MNRDKKQMLLDQADEQGLSPELVEKLEHLSEEQPRPEPVGEIEAPEVLRSLIRSYNQLLSMHNDQFAEDVERCVHDLMEVMELDEEDGWVFDMGTLRFLKYDLDDGS